MQLTPEQQKASEFEFSGAAAAPPSGRQQQQQQQHIKCTE